MTVVVYISAEEAVRKDSLSYFIRIAGNLKNGKQNNEMSVT